ncbi:uncharacterized protein B0I36DRAFT_345860 [Microdochium trichocladiopsis]|uniref:Uncharacterized protein n=1 Tax=Microdochium trichocladiopsis TaxID=1682393 RepID=A0A9P9BUM7_9PEZI|nr:uncharacterized protein B0I36DRAFT_345860 [Microdochium trichocladiopsis]KAH7037796.1 hypothetical protein B0I36DRAFT_345860 [Microdochium trichocladiopsis]
MVEQLQATSITGILMCNGSRPGKEAALCVGTIELGGSALLRRECVSSMCADVARRRSIRRGNARIKGPGPACARSPDAMLFRLFPGHPLESSLVQPKGMLPLGSVPVEPVEPVRRESGQELRFGARRSNLVQLILASGRSAWICRRGAGSSSRAPDCLRGGAGAAGAAATRHVTSKMRRFRGCWLRDLVLLMI